MTVRTLPPIPGAGLVNPIAAQPLKAKWILFYCNGGAGAVVASSGQTANGTNGALIPANTPVLYPQNTSDATDEYDLANLEAYVGAGSSLQITYGI